MSQENRTRVNKIMDDALRHGLRHFIFRQYTAKFGKGIDLDEMGRVLYRELKTKETTLEELDIQAWLKLMDRNWETVFRKKLGYTPRGYVNELRDVRNQNSHKNDLSTFTNEETHRIATTAIKLLDAIDKSELQPRGDINAKEQIPIIQKIKEELGHLIYSEREQKTTEEPAPANNISQPPIDNPKQPISQNQKVNHSALNTKTIIFVLMLIVGIVVIIALPNIIASLTIDECDPEILGQRYSGLNHAIETARCKGWLP